VIFFFRNIKRYSFPQGNGMLSAIGFCIDNLPDNIKCYYQDFAVFVEDVNIKPEVKLLLFKYMALISFSCNFEALVAELDF
jgi:hypothetical protein